MGFAKPDNTGARVWQCDTCGSTWAAPGGECAECVQADRDRYRAALLRVRDMAERAAAHDDELCVYDVLASIDLESL